MKFFFICIFTFIFPLFVSSDMTLTVNRVVEAKGLTEGPHWDHRTQKLFFVDIWGNKICRFDPATSKVTCAYIANGPVGVAIPIDDGANHFVAGSGVDVVLVTWDGETNSTNPPIRKLKSVNKFNEGTRFNDGKADSFGRFWAGTMSEIKGDFMPNGGEFYCMDKNLTLTTQITPVSISNGLAWNLDDDTFYYIDSPTKQIVSYDFDPQKGSIANRKVVFDLTKNNLPGVPDGMTIDSKDNLWIALFGGSQVIQVNPKTGKLLQSIPIPAKRVTSVTFGGPMLDILYVTTAGNGFANPAEKTPEDDMQGGSIFEIKGTGARGVLSNSFKMSDD
ncbi:regucalcin-like isoform X2 [Leptopilina boulardi]|uniref:regucalcin-like isoform X2 n=1 Tax=Leptopilina boulardi TaxID=63433 RepID=UPI0021F6772E|nr:regucalcin-like isoform X2 [Leptopilina boulardi]